MSEIPADDVQDTVEMYNDLSRWLYEHRNKMEIRKMTFMLITKASELITTYDLKDADLLFEQGIELGCEYGMERKDKP